MAAREVTMVKNLQPGDDEEPEEHSSAALDSAHVGDIQELSARSASTITLLGDPGARSSSRCSPSSAPASS